MASTARKIRLKTAKTKRMRSVTLPIASAGIGPPGPHPRPAWAAEEGAHSGQANGDSNEPGHDPPGEGLAAQRPCPSFPGRLAGLGVHQELGEYRGGQK